MRRRLVARLSLRYKIPLRVTALVILVALSVTSAIVLQQFGQARADLDRYSSSLARALANTLQPYLRHEDVWRAYEIVTAAVDETTPPTPSSLLVIVTGVDGSVFVSSRPREFPVSVQLTALGSDFVSFVAQRAAGRADEAAGIAVDGSDRLFYVVPISADSAHLGDVILIASRSALWLRYAEMLKQAMLVTLLALAVLLPASWFWARRTGAPLVSLAEAMGKVPARLDDIAPESLPDTGDEIGDLTRMFRLMLVDLKRKRALEQQVVASERLAAIGRLAAGIAHEINNPLGGMLNAISTYRRHGSDDPLANKTLALLERGLTQIRGSVGALLVETRLSDRLLTPEDVNDVVLLVTPEIEQREGSIVCNVQFDGSLPLPAGQVRQILLNLLLNAAHAIERLGVIRLDVRRRAGEIAIQVYNDGRHISEEKLPYLFEPFTLARGEGSGLGLWVVYQIVSQLAGELTVVSSPGTTIFTVLLPLAPDAPETSDEPAAATVPD